MQNYAHKSILLICMNYNAKNLKFKQNLDSSNQSMLLNLRFRVVKRTTILNYIMFFFYIYVTYFNVKIKRQRKPKEL